MNDTLNPCPDTQSLGSVKLSQIQKALEKLRKANGGDIDLNFEFIIGSFFPNAYSQMIDLLKKEHTAGYIEGYTAGKEVKEYVNEN